MLARESNADSYSLARLDYHAALREMPTTSARANACSTSARGRSRWPSYWPSSCAPAAAATTRSTLAKAASRVGGLPGLVPHELFAEHGMGEAKSTR